MNEQNEDYCEECDCKKKCDRLKRCVIEWEALAAWSENGDDPYYELNRQMSKPLHY